jgi:hypothetical protein
MLGRGLRVANAREHIEAGKDEPPEDEQEREQMRARRTMAEGPHGGPDATDHDGGHGAEVGREPDTAAGDIGPEDDGDAERDGEGEARVADLAQRYRQALDDARRLAEPGAGR